MVERHAVMRTAVLTALALLCFAGNSLLCRAALRPGAIDPASFTLVRLASGAFVLLALDRARRERRTAPLRGRELLAPAALFAYAIAFSFAYLRLTAGTGALVLFGTVQVTMLVAAVRAGERPRPPAWFGILVAIGGLVGLTFPGLGAPDPLGAALMGAAGVSWAIYTLRGRKTKDPIGTTAQNFVWSLPLAGIVWAARLAMTNGVHAEPDGLVLATLSGGIASGIGYAVWYTALPALSATSAAVLQLSVPALTAALAVLLLGEPLSARLILSSIAVLGGIGIVVRHR